MYILSIEEIEMFQYAKGMIYVSVIWIFISVTFADDFNLFVSVVKVEICVVNSPWLKISLKKDSSKF